MEDIIGNAFGRWTVLAFSHKSEKWNVPHWLCRCECGVEKVVQQPQFGRSKSCGCLAKELRLTRTMHGESRRGRHTPEYRAWIAIKSRCSPTDTGSASWHRYGGRGIKVCAEWASSYEAFFAFVGRRPTRDHSLDRHPDPDGNYEPGNVRWATQEEQHNNQKRSWPRLDGSMKLRSPKKVYIHRAIREVISGKTMASICDQR